MAIQGRKDYLMLQMVEGTMTFTVDNGRGPIMAVFKPDSKFKFCDGNWHEIHGKKKEMLQNLSKRVLFMKFLHTYLPTIFSTFFSAVKAKYVVTLSVDDIFAQPGIGVPGVSSTDTNHGLFIGGHPRTDRLTGLRTDTNYVGCIKNIVIENKPLQVRGEMLKGDIMSHVCPMT